MYLMNSTIVATTPVGMKMESDDDIVEIESRNDVEVIQYNTQATASYQALTFFIDKFEHTE